MNTLTENIYTYNRYINGNLQFMSNKIYNMSFFDSIAEMNGIQIIDFKLLKGGVENNLIGTRHVVI
jgi:hypothetical protein